MQKVEMVFAQVAVGQVFFATECAVYLYPIELCASPK